MDSNRQTLFYTIVVHVLGLHAAQGATLNVRALTHYFPHVWYAWTHRHYVAAEQLGQDEATQWHCAVFVGHMLADLWLALTGSAATRRAMSFGIQTGMHRVASALTTWTNLTYTLHRADFHWPIAGEFSSIFLALRQLVPDSWRTVVSLTFAVAFFVTRSPLYLYGTHGRAAVRFSALVARRAAPCATLLPQRGAYWAGAEHVLVQAHPTACPSVRPEPAYCVWRSEARLL